MMRFTNRLTGFLFWVILVWCWGAIYFDVPLKGSMARAALATVWAAAVIWASHTARSTSKRLLLRFVGLLLVIIPWLCLRPQGERDWSPEYARQASVTRNGDELIIENLRNFDYKADGSMLERWERRVVHLSQLRGIDFMLNYWGMKQMAHPIMSFDFGPEGQVAFSVETRRERGEAYSNLGGLYKKYELIYLACDERDVVRVRTNYRAGEEVYLYRLRTSPEQARQRFLEFASVMNQLVAKPRFYDVITTNCTTSIVNQIPGRKKWDWRLLINGYLDELFYERGLLETNVSFEKLKSQSLINEWARSADQDLNFSREIRSRNERPVPK